MKKLSILLIVCLMGWAAQATLIDCFNDGLTNYTSTVILDNDHDSVYNTASWQINTNGQLQLDTTGYDNIEQYAMIYSGLSLAVGEELQMDLAHTGASQDLGLYVGGTTPSTDVRYDYIAMYARVSGTSDQVFSRGFDGSTEYVLAGNWGTSYDKLFIARTDTNVFEAGYYSGTTRNVLATRTPSTANEADVVGFYADVRATGVLGNGDNLTIIPEPATIALLGLGGLLLRKKR